MSEHASAQRSTKGQATPELQTSTTETAASGTLDARQLSTARIMQMQRTMGNRAVQHMVQRMGTVSPIVQRAGGLSSTASVQQGSAPVKTPAEERKESMDAERDAKVTPLVNTAFTDIRAKLEAALKTYLTSDSKAATIRQSVKDKVIAEIEASMGATGTAEQRADALKFAKDGAEGIMQAKLTSYAGELTVSQFAEEKKRDLTAEANKAYDLVTPSLNESAFTKQKSKAAKDAEKLLATRSKILIANALATSKTAIVTKFASTASGGAGGFDRIDVGTTGTAELTNRIGLENELVDKTVVKTEKDATGNDRNVYDMENIYRTTLHQPMKQAVLLKLGVGRGEFRRSKELNEFRDKLKTAAREKVNQQIEAEITRSQSPASAGGGTSGTSPSPALTAAMNSPMKAEYMKMATKAIAYKDSKQLVDEVMATEADAIIEALTPKNDTITALTNIGKSAAYEVARKSGSTREQIRAAGVKAATAQAEKLLKEKKDLAVLEARKVTKGTKAVGTTAATRPDPAKTQQVIADIQDNDKTKKMAKTVITKSVEAPDLNSGFAKIGKLIDISTPNPGDSSSLEFELKIPVASAAGGGHAYFLFGFGGEAEREAEDLTVNSQLTFGAGFTTFGFDANARFGLFLEGKGKDTDSVMNLLSYGLYREMATISSAAAGHFWGKGGRSGDSKLVEAEKWAMMVEEQHLVDESEINVGGLAKLAMEANVGVAEFSAEVAFKRLSKYNKEIIEKKGKDATGARMLTATERLANGKSAIGKGELNTTVEAGTEIEIGFGKDKVAFGLEGSITKTRNEAGEWILKELGLELSATIPSQFGEEGGDFTNYVSKIVTAAIGGGKNVSALLKKAFSSEVEADKGKRTAGTVLDAGSDALFTGNYFDDIGTSFAEKIQGDETVNDTMRSWLPGQDDSASSIETVNKIGLSNALKLGVAFKKEYEGWDQPGNWEISIEASQVKSLEVDAEIVKVAVEKAKRLGKLEFAKGKTTKYEGLGFAGGGQDRPAPTTTP
ncbi:hypothetical protein [Paenibacillus whitsoniae]|uniref:Uncharacterized protein n=1 Tax=Paenibacillus whitsoniae TaxID=2496558 RepID=A0A3S0C588_9BACL|nr:hypothetical protein [Paenibacillus whitsoniae]RTE03539.1 hypothetical protein EJQ19_27825 [Paenibacillus whitsoniae]